MAGVALLAAATLAGAAETGDGFCDPKVSTSETCVVTKVVTVADQTVLRFTTRNVELRGSIRFMPHCADDPATLCSADAQCPCVRMGAFTVQVTGLLTVAFGAKILDQGQATAHDAVGPDGGTITIVAGSLTVAGMVSATALGASGVPAGHGGHVIVAADANVKVTGTGAIDASTAAGGCGGTIEIGSQAAAPASLDLAEGSLLDVDGATFGGTLELFADSLLPGGRLQASNTNGDQSRRPDCGDRSGGGAIWLRAGRVLMTGTARARGNKAGGGTVHVQAVQAVTVDSPAGVAAISVSGGDPDAFTSGGGIFLIATAGDVALQQGTIEADGSSAGFGSDAGTFSLKATGTSRCETSALPCNDKTDCQPGEACIEYGGNVLVQGTVSAAGGAGKGSGGLTCEIRGTGTVNVSGPVDVGAGRQSTAVGGKLTIAAGRDLTLGPGAITADGADGGAIVLVAGERAGATRAVSGLLRVVGGTQVRTDAFLGDGVGGDLDIDACEVALEPSVVLSVDGGTHGFAGRFEATVHDRIDVGPLAHLSALPSGTVAFAYRTEATIAPDATVAPTLTLVQDPSIPICPACGNDVTEGLEECDGSAASCPIPSDVCLPPGTPAQCTCKDTCGTVAGIQAGEECDGADLGGATCVSLGFLDGTLACAPDCTFDTTGCEHAVCGDGIVGAGEVCDPGGLGGAPPSFGGATCETEGFPDGGTLACTATCGAIITFPHCSTSVGEACRVDGDCPAPAHCWGGCRQCGNGFLDPGEDCDDGVANGSSPNHCRSDCRAPICGDAIVDVAHCAGAVDTACGGPQDCAPGDTCVAGEECDAGPVQCVGGERAGETCCAESDCPGGDCPGEDDCSGNRDDVPGCCACDCRSRPTCENCDDGDPCTDDTCDGTACRHVAVADGASCGGGDACHAAGTCRAGVCVAGPRLACDDGNPCTADGCDVATGCRHDEVADGTACGNEDRCTGVGACAAGRCVAAAPLNCDDASVCTIDRCIAPGTCTHQRIGFTEARGAIAASLVLGSCATDTVPERIRRLLQKSDALVLRAEAAPGEKAGRLLGRAMHRLREAAGRARRAWRHGVSTACADALSAIIDDARLRAMCLVP